MSFTNFLPSFAISTTLAVMPVMAAAQDQSGFSLGVGAGIGSGIYVGESNQSRFLPLVRYESDGFSVSIPEGLRVTIADTGPLRFSAVVSPRLSEIEQSESSELDGLDRETTLDGGLQARYQFESRGSLTFRLVTELTDEHNGSEATLTFAQPFPVGSVPVVARAGVIWQSEDLGDYLYGVSSSEATVDRAAYALDDTFTPFVGLGTSIPVSDNVRVVGNLRAAFLLDEISDSSIIDEDVDLRAFVGINLSL